MKILDYPHATQTYEYDCGATVLQTIFTYYGSEIRKELIYKTAKTNSRKGTLLKGMMKALQHYKYDAQSQVMTIDDVIASIDRGHPVILLLHAWENKVEDYAKYRGIGHWVAAIGYDKSKIIFEDPYAFSRAYLTHSELMTRWHANEGKTHLVNHGIVITNKKPAYKPDRIVHMD